MRAPPGAEAPGYATTPGEPGFGRGLARKAPLRGVVSSPEVHFRGARRNAPIIWDAPNLHRLRPFEPSWQGIFDAEPGYLSSYFEIALALLAKGSPG